MIGSINGSEWLILVVIALIVIGPERLPGYAKQLGNVVREVRRMAKGATARVREEMGPELDELTSFDPRQYDPRRIIREAMGDDLDLTERPRPSGAARPGAGAPGVARAGAGSVPAGSSSPGTIPYDDEAT